MTPITRDDITGAVRRALEPLPYVDLQADAEDDRAADVFDAVESALRELSPIELRYVLPEPTWHGHSQRFYRLRDASEFLVIDFVVVHHSKPDKFLQRELHGEPIVYFDKSGVVRPEPVDRKALKERLRDRVESLNVNFQLFGLLAPKEIWRGNPLDALVYYHGFTLRPLVEMLRISRTPERHGFYVRYARHDLPSALVGELTDLFYVRDAADLLEKHARAKRLFVEALAEARESLAERP